MGQLNNTHKNYSDFYKHGDQEKCYKFRGFLSTVKEPKTKLTEIYDAYTKWCKNTGVIPVSRNTFLNIIKERFNLEVRGRSYYVNAEYRYKTDVIPFPSTPAPVQEPIETAEDSSEPEEDLFDKIMSGKTESVTFDNNLEEEVDEDEVIEIIEESMKEDKELSESIQLEQMAIVESFESIEKIKYENKIKKLEDLKDSLLDRELNSTQLISLIQKIIAE